jgi:hypothetical protein
MVFSADYVRNISTHYLLATDANHSGDVSLFNPTLAAADIAATLGACGAATVTASTLPGGCAGGPAAGLPVNANGSANIQTFAVGGLDSAYDLGGAACPQCAFSAVNPKVGPVYSYDPSGRSVYNGMDLKLTQNMNHPFRGLKYLNFQATYTLSRYVNAGSTGSGTSVAGGDADFVADAISNRNALGLMGPGSLDRLHQFNFGGYGDLPLGFRLGLISHFWSPLAATPTVLPVQGSVQSGTDGGIFNTDFIGSGQIGNPLPQSVNSSCGAVGGSCDYDLYHVGAFMRSLSVGGLTNAVSNYNSKIGGILPTPAGQQLINCAACGITLANLQALGGVASPVAPVDPGEVGFAWLKTFDVEASWVYHFRERLTLQPSVSIFNVLNMANFDSPANALTGQLNGGPGSINGTEYAGRPDRIGAGTGVFAFGAPRTIEWGLKLTF